MNSPDELFAGNDARLDVLLDEITARIGRYCAVVSQISSFTADQQFFASPRQLLNNGTNTALRSLKPIVDGGIQNIDAPCNRV